jgi:hypothetical protein
MQNIPNKKWTEIPRKRKIEKKLEALGRFGSEIEANL